MTEVHQLHKQVRDLEKTLIGLQQGTVTSTILHGIQLTITNLSSCDAYYSVEAFHVGKKYVYPETDNIEDIVEEILIIDFC